MGSIRVYTGTYRYECANSTYSTSIYPSCVPVLYLRCTVLVVFETVQPFRHRRGSYDRLLNLYSRSHVDYRYGTRSLRRTGNTRSVRCTVQIRTACALSAYIPVQYHQQAATSNIINAVG